jgi:hypothetical protein
MNRYVSLILFLVLVLGGGLAIGYVTAPGAWYAGLAKPSFNPPGLAIRPGLDGALCADRGGRLAYLRARSPRLADAAVVGAARAQFPVVAGVLLRPPDRAGASSSLSC